MGRKSFQTVMKPKQVTTDEKQMIDKKCADKNTKDCNESVS